ncbi:MULTISPECIES: hypothetical protein [unclassified Streptomyces]|uniref:hypothetical protein n=1 Tax=unclassified Streptomyces TaxID=2593676 RepID=UPI00369AAFC8
MAQDRETRPDAERYPAEGDITGIGRRPHDERSPGEPLPGEPVRNESAHRPEAEVAGRLPGAAGAGREGLTADDRVPGEGAGSPAAATGAGRSERPDTHRQAPGTTLDDDPMPDNGLGAPSPGGLGGREAATTEGTAADAWPGGAGRHGRQDTGAHAPLLAQEESEQWEERLRHTLAGFVEEPRSAVEEADRTLEEIAARFGEAVTRRRRNLRMSWQNEKDGGPGRESDTEQLRLALRDYRELADRLLHL